MCLFDGKNIIAVTSRELCPRPLWEQIPRIREAGITRVILREKDLSAGEYLALAEKVLRACEACCVDLTIHSFPEAAEALGVKSLHMPLDLLEKDLYRCFPNLGTSVHSIGQLRKAESFGVSYVTAGHIFTTDCKKDLAPRGLGFLSDICGKTDLPVYAIGGITPENLPEVFSCGAGGACIMSFAMRL